MKKSNLVVFFALLLLVSCTSVKLSQEKAFAVYQKAIENSMSPTEDKVYDRLVTINSQNENLVRKTINGEEHILVVTWKQNISFYQKYIDSTHYNTGSYQIWVTTAPELYQRMKKEHAKDVDMRLKQLLGLPPNATYSYFVEFWVKPEDLFRPCPDKEITDNACELCFPKDTEESYQDWINKNRISRYYGCEIDKKYPWSQLGYTYDWNPRNKSHIGLSEFVIDVNKNIVVNAIYTTKEYLNKEMDKQ